jgi:mannose-6-phosphate isomerase
MLDLLHPIDVEPGDVVYVAPGMLHAIGGGVFLVEVQEPEDLSILLEWNGFAIDGRRDGHLGLGFDLALGAVDRHVVDADELATLVRPAGFGPSVLPPAADPYFRMERRRITGSEELAPGFAIVLIMAGSLSIELDEPLDAAVGTTMVVPHGAGPLNIAGVGEIVACRPPV